MALRIREEDEDDITFLYRAIEINLNIVPPDYKDEAYTSMLFRGMSMQKEGQSRGYVYKCLHNKAIDWYRFSKRRKDLNEVYQKKIKMEEINVGLDRTGNEKNKDVASNLIRVHKCATSAQKRVIKDLLKFLVKNPDRQWDAKESSVRLNISVIRLHVLVREIKSLYRALYKMDRGDDSKSVQELYDYVKFRI